MNLNEIKKLIRIFEKSKIGELEIVEENHKIRMSRNDQPVINPSNINGGGTTYILPSNSAAQSPNTAENPGIQSGVDTAKQAEEESTINYFEVRAPMVGTFYRAPSPDAEPYVDVGDSISTGQTLCIIEAMKLMNEIQSETEGKVVKILLENAQPVEYNQILFLVERK
jgi:acetyl-CoA carboxylase biotin carboxyl carrier protein